MDIARNNLDGNFSILKEAVAAESELSTLLDVHQSDVKDLRTFIDNPNRILDCSEFQNIFNKVVDNFLKLKKAASANCELTILLDNHTYYLITLLQFSEIQQRSSKVTLTDCPN